MLKKYIYIRILKQVYYFTKKYFIHAKDLRNIKYINSIQPLNYLTE